MMHTSFIVAIAALLALARAEVGPCRFDKSACSCKMGEENQGVCWDPIQNDPLNCKPRSCKRGWTCSCGDRTHLCDVGMLSSRHNTGAAVTMKEILAPKQIQQLVRQESLLVRPCTTMAVETATKTDIKLGTIKFQFSETGSLANK
jgi:hypothetical protein